MIQYFRKYEIAFASIVILLLLITAIIHVMQGPYPTVWDDANYAVKTFEWIKTIQEMGVINGILIGLKSQLPGQYPPMVFITSLAGGLLGKTIIAMRLSHLFWFVITLWSTFRIGKIVGGFNAGILSVLIVSTMPPVFYWSQMIMGEPALFATLSLCLLFIIEWGDRMSPFRAGIFGGIFGLGLLSKQHFWLIVIMPICIWLLWLSYQSNNKSSHRQFAIMVCSFVGCAVVVAGPWYFVHYKPLLAYALQADFEPHLLGPKVSWRTLSSQTDILLNNVGFVGCFLSLVGLLWGLISLGKIVFTGSTCEWKSFAPLLLMTGGLANVIAAIFLRSSNPRFFAPAFLLFGFLAAFSINDLLAVNRKIGFPVATIVVGLHLLTWIHLCFGMNISVWPNPILAQYPWAKPQDVAPLNNAIAYLATQNDSTKRNKIRLLGATNLFNPPLIQAVILEKGHSFEIAPLYRWSEKGINKETLFKRLLETDLLIVQRYGGVGTPILSRHNSTVFELIDNNTAIFDKVWTMESNSGHNIIEIYKNLTLAGN